MLHRPVRFLSVCALAAFACLATMSGQCRAGNNNNPGIAPAGVEVDAKGVLRSKGTVADPGGRLTKQRKNAAKAALEADIMRGSKLRMVSLNRLEAAVAKRLEASDLPTEDMMYLAGLTQITHVFYYPETKDVVVAGPAEGFYEGVDGRIRGIKTDKPVLRLEDLVVALREFSPMGDRASVIGCSIDPTQEGLQKMQKYLTSIGRNITKNDDMVIARNLKENLGLQTVSVSGVSAKTRFARVMVEADYRMKLIGIGLLEPAAKIKSFVKRADPNAVSRNALQRWYFQPDYDCIRVSEDDLAMEMVNSKMNLVGENERVGADGVRKGTGGTNRASDQFCKAFTKEYSKLAENDSVFAELQSLCDMSIVAAYIQHQNYYSKADWDMELFTDEERFPVEIYAEPKQVETAVNAVWKGSRLMTPIGGGVIFQPQQALKGENLQYAEDGKIGETRQQATLKDLPADKWWWD